MTSNKHLDLEKTKIFVRAKCDLEVISKDKGKKADIRESCKTSNMQREKKSDNDNDRRES